MESLLTALDRPFRLRDQLWLTGIVAGTTCLFVIAPQILFRVSRLNPILFQGVVAVWWVHWLGWSFPLHWKRQLRCHGRERAYSAAFYTDIIPGVCVNFSQILRPLACGALAFSWSFAAPWRIAAGCVAVAVGGVLVVMGLRTIGIAGAMFVWEYRLETPALSRRSVYGYLRHPLFIGGVITSLGFGSLFSDPVPLGVAAINILLTPVFLIAESRRSTIVFGKKYLAYQKEVGAFLPRLTRLLSIFRVGRRKRRLAMRSY